MLTPVNLFSFILGGLAMPIRSGVVPFVCPVFVSLRCAIYLPGIGGLPESAAAPFYWRKKKFSWLPPFPI
mgnify:CR=1 FL=1